MKGIADGASDAGAKWLGRRIDLMDIVVANTTVEMGELASAMPMTPTGLEGTALRPARLTPRKHDSVMDHCSAFAATGPATRDGKMVIGHVTWWPLTLAEQTNVMLDIQPDKGHRMLMQSYPGGIESGTDWYQNDAGMVLTETTIRQTPFNAQGTPVAFRARMAIQYGGNVDEVVERLGTRNNGLYTNEWLIGDAKNNEIAMYELGTNHTKLWRSSKNEWFGGTPGFLLGRQQRQGSGCAAGIRSRSARRARICALTCPRSATWPGRICISKYQGQIDETVRLSWRSTAPAGRCVHHGCQGRRLRPGQPHDGLGRDRPAQRERTSPQRAIPKNDGLYPGGYVLFSAQPTDSLSASIGANEKARLATEKKDQYPEAPARFLKERSRQTLERLDAARFRCRHMVRRRNRRLLSRPAIGRCRECHGSRAHPLSRPEAFRRMRPDNAFALRKRPRSAVPRFPPPKNG